MLTRLVRLSLYIFGASRRSATHIPLVYRYPSHNEGRWMNKIFQVYVWVSPLLSILIQPDFKLFAHAKDCNMIAGKSK